MNITVTTFTSPFSFFCKPQSDTGYEYGEEYYNMADNVPNPNVSRKYNNMLDIHHGQYVAVTWKGKWVRGIVSLESSFAVWLIDYGFYLRLHDDKNVIADLQPEYKKHPSKVFEASIHGVCPIKHTLQVVENEVKAEISTSWDDATISKAKALIASATGTYFVPVALLDTKHNDIVLGDLYLHTDKGFTNIVDKLVDEANKVNSFLEKSPNEYINRLPKFYTSRRRKHRVCVMPPDIPGYKVPRINLATTLQEYNDICARAPPFVPPLYVSVVSRIQKMEEYKLTHAEIDKYSKMTVTIHDQENNVLTVLLGKLRDFRLSKKYKDHDLKGIGRACSRRRTVPSNMVTN